MSNLPLPLRLVCEYQNKSVIKQNNLVEDAEDNLNFDLKSKKRDIQIGWFYSEFNVY